MMEKYPFFEFYTRWPRSIARKLQITFIGGWWCDGCKKYHGRRVKAFHRFYLSTKLYCSQHTIKGDVEINE